MRPLNLLNKKFGKLTVTKRLPNQITKWSNNTYWECRCDCGNTRFVIGKKLNNGHTRSCGCSHVDRRLSDNIAAINVVYANYKYGAKKRNLPFEMTKEYFIYLSQQPCDYCKSLPNSSFRPHNERNVGDYFIYNGVDRINSDLGYVMGNIVSCCAECNWMKLNKTKEYFFDLIKKIYEINNLGSK